MPGAEGLYLRATYRKGKTFTVIARRKKDGKQIWAKVPADDIDIDTISEDDLDVICAMARAAVARIKRGDEPFPPPARR